MEFVRKCWIVNIVISVLYKIVLLKPSLQGAIKGMTLLIETQNSLHYIHITRTYMYTQCC